MCEALYDYAICGGGCPGATRDHTLRYIAGRATNVALGAVHAATSGYYDNALLACRALGEQANLVGLLVHSPEALAVYKAGDKRERMRTLGPRAVRKALEELDLPTVVTSERAELLSQRVVHPSFDEIILAHNFRAIVVGPVWQQAGFVLCLNETAIALGGYMFLAGEAGISQDEKTKLLEAGEAVFEGIGRLQINDLMPGLQQTVPEHRWLGGADREAT